jgi:hypothetical protein
MKTPGVMIEVCLAELREYLAGYRGYPPTEAGEKRFASAIQENCVSVGHVRAMLKSFEVAFPTVREIHDVALNLRPQFEQKKDEREEWKRKYGEERPFEKYPADTLACHWQAFRDMLYYTEGPGQAELNKILGEKDRRKDIEYWERARLYDLDPRNGHAPAIEFVRRQVKDLGWPAIMELTASAERMPYTNPIKYSGRGSMRQIAAPITQADIEAAKEDNRKRQAEDAKAEDEDGWNDPDR